MVYVARCSVVTDEVTPSGSKPPQAKSESPPRKSESEEAERLDPVDWGYDLYPERRGEKYQPSWKQVLFHGEGKENFDKLRCEENVYNCVKNSM
jgi:inner membrane protease ATP23